ncbi:MAG: endopeptidase La [Candidatus Hydrogenedentes bacterium]|jgi:ATP-dependent Lon protease|nr:endopeptidase La [Candidatus Hydrogenedentota bacterium]
MAPRKKEPESPFFDLPLLTLRDAVVFPRMVVPLFIGRPPSVAAVEKAYEEGSPLFLCAQKDASEETPKASGLYRVGTAAKIVNILRLPDMSMKVVVEGMARGRVRVFRLGSLPYMVSVEKIVSPTPHGKDLEGLMRAVLHQFEEYVRLTQRIAPEVFLTIQAMSDPDLFADTVCAFLFINAEERQELLECIDVTRRLEKLSVLLAREIELAEIEYRVRNRVREQMERGQREHYLQEQMRVIQQELGSREDGGNEFTELRDLLDKAGMPKEVKAKADREFQRYERLPLMSPESAVLRGYLEWLCDMPWSKSTRDSIDLNKASEVLDADHFGLEKVKERILEFLAVRKLNKKGKGPILCLVGPPGVGKTSLGQSIARAMGRVFVRVSLGGIRDEAEIRGHRRTYVGAMPGRLIQSIKDAGVKNPLFMLDEVDKMNVDFRGDPSSALLEALDPEQNKHFSDHYLEVGFDLSEVFFITTANSEYNIPFPLQDRMEMVRLPGYTHEEKAQIARLFLIPRQVASSGLKPRDVAFTDDGLNTLIQRYTREAGVRELERAVASLCRKTARKIVDRDKAGLGPLDTARIVQLLGPPPYAEVTAETESETGVAIGLAWTQAGGETLRVETSLMPGKGGLMLTGQLGEVMKESATAAFSYIRANAMRWRINPGFYKNQDLHVHVPEGAIPKDGPSAGLAMLVSLLSALTGTAPAPGLAMTGEITLRGKVLPVGGVKEKVLAARRAGIQTIVLPRENEKDFPDLPAEVRDNMHFVLVSTVDQALETVFPPARPAVKRRAGARQSHKK